MKIDFEKIDNINVDLVIGFGSTCRVAESLNRNGLRYFSSPFDWMLNYSLDTVISLVSSCGRGFFEECIEDKNFQAGFSTGIVDKRNGMISMHDFPNDLPIEKAPKFFKKKYQRKFSNLNILLKKAQQICFLTNREISLCEMQKFIIQIKKLYSFEHIYFINIYDTNNAEIESFEKFEESGTTYIIYKFNDEHIFGREKSKNPDFWLGNVNYWDNILSKIKLNKKFSDIKN